MNFLGLTTSVQNVQNTQTNFHYALRKAPSQSELVAKLAEQMPSFSFKSLTSQIVAMSDLDEASKVGKTLNLVA